MKVLERPDGLSIAIELFSSGIKPANAINGGKPDPSFIIFEDFPHIIIYKSVFSSIVEEIGAIIPAYTRHKCQTKDLLPGPVLQYEYSCG